MKILGRLQTFGYAVGLSIAMISTSFIGIFIPQVNLFMNEVLGEAIESTYKKSKKRGKQ